MYELWNPEGKLAIAFKEATIEYASQTTESRLIRIPFVKRFIGEDLAVSSFTDRSLYRKIEDSMKKESVSKRDEW